MHTHRMLALSVLIVVAFLLFGCGADSRTESEGKREMVSESHTTTTTVTRETPLENGGREVRTVTKTDVTAGERSTTSGKENTHTGPDGDAAALAGTLGNVAGAVMNKATGGLIPEGAGTALTALILAGITAYGGAKRAESNQLRQERDFHKEDAEKGWTKYQEAAAKT